jgi:hypothetical protein
MAEKSNKDASFGRDWTTRRRNRTIVGSGRLERSGVGAGQAK